MKIALCTEVLYPLYGVERRVYEMAKRLPRLGFDVTVYTSTSPEHTPELDVVQVSKPTITKPPERNYIRCFEYWFGLYKRLIRDDYDVIDANGHMSLVPCSIGSKKTGKPVIATIHDLYLGDWRKMQSGFGGFAGLPFELLSAKMHFDRVITLNKTVRSKMEQMLKIKNVGIIPSGIDTKYIDSVKGAAKKEARVMYAGRLVPQKNVGMLIRAFANIKNAELILVGEGSEKPMLERLASSLNLKNVKFTKPFRRHEDLIRCMKSATVLALPSKRENFGIVPLEAMRCGTAVVSTATDGPKDFIKSGSNGFLTPIGNENELADKIQLLLEDRKLRRKIESNGRKTSESYDWGVIVKKIADEYRRFQ